MKEECQILRFQHEHASVLAEAWSKKCREDESYYVTQIKKRDSALDMMMMMQAKTMHEMMERLHAAMDLAGEIKREIKRNQSE
jgi:enolase